ncbi:hypothetical protein B0H17DRAFT_1149902 [Mycena rosella]|uniref:Uncharacterized protein n=1 Tax=Mycena rosella TaxID=1033263 RepID=A0AAD7BZE9_MYCRO|nr:hypothetical protein B0H17DRAFT_1149902 [Mycena rosella]
MPTQNWPVSGHVPWFRVAARQNLSCTRAPFSWWLAWFDNSGILVVVVLDASNSEAGTTFRPDVGVSIELWSPYNEIGVLVPTGPATASPPSSNYADGFTVLAREVLKFNPTPKTISMALRVPFNFSVFWPSTATTLAFQLPHHSEFRCTNSYPQETILQHSDPALMWAVHLGGIISSRIPSGSFTFFIEGWFINNGTWGSEFWSEAPN